MTTMTANRILFYEVRRPGNTARSEHRTEKAAKREQEKANRICCPGHEVYAVHQNGDRTGPY